MYHLYIIINKPPEQWLRLPITQHLSSEGENFLNRAHLALFLTQRSCYVIMLNGHHAIALQPVGLNLSEGWKLCPLWHTCFLHNDGSFPKHVWNFRVNVVAQKLNHRITQHKNNLE